ncbi:nitric oxide reductase D protein [Paracoccus sp. Z118]|uniref:nitric oxide reductase activation protein NorD n=1 Tax=Paracoccus sp. Z118 TaxID=2851017 RepID=UPI001C2C1578|nr:nitric oxide reductase D protein [Paracoccus sp. Z118]MBV0891445.1 nitric oxide reductase D protein [Paracoccus sp. Z118]
MSAWREIEPWEPEETVGKLWHGWASGFDALPMHEDARVELTEVAGRLAVLFRGLGGDHSVEFRSNADRVSRHRLSWRRKLGTVVEAIPQASFDGAILRMPASLALLPTPEANGALYLWLAAAAAHAAGGRVEDDPLRRDLARLIAARATVEATLESAPGMTGLYHELSSLMLATRPVSRLPANEAAVEALARALLGDPAPLPPRAEEMLAAIESGDLSGIAAPSGYRPMRPVVLWPDLEGDAASEATRVETRDTEGTPEESTAGEKTVRARRRKADAADRRDSLILHKFEAILSWAEFLNLNRRVEDDDDDSARKALDDQDELGLGQISKAPATRLKLHLDLSPEDVDREAISGVHVYPEWEARSGTYLRDHVRVLDSTPEPTPGEEAAPFDEAARRRIRAVRQRFEALRPGRVTTTGHRDGDELDLELTVRSQVGLVTSGQGSDRIWRQTRPEARDLAVSILLDVSRSTESAVTGRAVIDIEREALAALAWGLDGLGDAVSVQAFSSLKRDRVFVRTCKTFDEPMSAAVEARIAALRPIFYTRLGAGIRHVSKGLSTQARRRRLLLVITDGKPNDLDHYEGRHGIEDSAMAVREARRAGHAVFGITVDRDGKSWFPRIFGQGGFALVPHPDKLPETLPSIYRQLVGA